MSQKKCFPDNFKLSHVVPIPKTAAPKQLGYFQFRSFLNNIKMFVKLLKNKMLDFINKNNLLTSEKFGFTTNSSIEQAIAAIYDMCLDNLENKS